MKPIDTDDCNFSYVLDGGTEENDLRCVRDELHHTVTSFWVAEEGEDVAGADFLWIWLTQSPLVPVEIAWADTLDGATFEPLKLHCDEDGDGAIAIPLSERDRNWLRAGSTFVLRVHAIPTPPVSMTFGYSEAVQEEATAA